MGGAAAGTAGVVGDKKVGIYGYNYFEHWFICVSPQGWNVLYYSRRHAL